MANLMNVFALRRPRHYEKTVDNPKIKDGLRKFDDVKAALQKVQKVVLAAQEKGILHAKAAAVVGQHLQQFPDKDRAMPVPSQNPDESGFVIGMHKFSNIVLDLSSLEMSFCEETGKLAASLQDFIDKDLTENTKVLRKQYDNSRNEYDKILLKIATLKDNKKLPVVKVYEAEKERSRLFKVYEKATKALEDHLDDLDDLVSIIVAEHLVEWATSQKNQLGLSYSLMDDIKDYLLSLKQWCSDEVKVWESHRRERETSRIEVRQEEAQFLTQQFASTFTLDLIHLCSSIGQVDSPTMISSFCCMFHAAGLPLPDGLEKFPGANLDPSAKAAIDIQHFVREHIDAIGAKLLGIEEDQRDLLVTLGESLANLEKDRFHAVY